MATTKKQKHGKPAEPKGKLSLGRKEYEKELGRLQVELQAITRLLRSPNLAAR